MLVTHCGSEIVAGGDRRAKARLKELADEYGIRIDLAVDAMEWEPE
jgi:hypothetical protein